MTYIQHYKILRNPINIIISWVLKFLQSIPWPNLSRLEALTDINQVPIVQSTVGY